MPGYRKVMKIVVAEQEDDFFGIGLFVGDNIQEIADLFRGTEQE